MSKIATYLNEHLMGEVLTTGSRIDSVSVDGGVLLERPEMLVEAANTSDIRKVARFCWQLAEKGHVLPVVVRGAGTGSNGAAISSGIVLSEEKYMNRVIGIDTKQRLIHVQAGASYDGTNMALSTHKGLTLPYSSYDGSNGTIGGAIASGSVGILSSRFGSIGSVVQKLEVVVSSGEVIQTGRLTKRELSVKKGLQTLEGEIYRQIDNLINDNSEPLKNISDSSKNTVGFSGISQVKRKDGSFDLTPLFVGSQGALGIISEAIIQAQFARPEFSVVVASYAKTIEAHEAADIALQQKISHVEIIDGRLLARAASHGKKRDYAPVESFKGAIVVAILDDYSAKIRERSAKKLKRELAKAIAKPISVVELSHTAPELAELMALRTIFSSSVAPGEVGPGVFSGIWLPTVNLDVYLTELKKLEAEYGVALPYSVDMTSGFLDLVPLFDIKKVSDRQKLIKIITAVADLTNKFNGNFAGHGGDGRLKGAVNQKFLSDEEKAIFAQIKVIFDPHNILNPGVKQEIDPKTLVTQLNSWSRAQV